MCNAKVAIVNTAGATAFSQRDRIVIERSPGKRSAPGQIDTSKCGKQRHGRSPSIGQTKQSPR
jgi:hypothetical protein